MKKTFQVLALVLAMLAAFSPVSMATTITNQVSVNASVQSALALDVVIIQHDSGADSSVASMNYGQLTPNASGGLSSTRFFTVYLTGKTQGLPYSVTQTSTAAPTAGAATLPTGACKVTPVYVAADNGGAAQPAGSTLGTAGTWVATNKLVYSSETGTAQQRTVQAIYGLVGDPAQGAGNFVPSNQAAGNYSGTITYTLTA